MEKAGPKASFCGIAVMAKASRAGLTKTRLTPPLTQDEAAAFNTAFMQDIADNLLRAAAQTSIAGYFAYGPPGSESFFHDHLPPAIELLEVWYPDFGLCLMRALEAQFALGHKAAGVLNSDSPTLPSAFLVEAARVLEAPGERLVLGPSTDGGYYFLGCKVLHPKLFTDIAWSTDAVAGQTLERAREIGVPVHLLPAWYDVDDAASLRLLTGELLESAPFHPQAVSSPAPHTAAILQRMRAEHRLGFLPPLRAASPAPAVPSLPVSFTAT